MQEQKTSSPGKTRRTHTGKKKLQESTTAKKITAKILRVLLTPTKSRHTQKMRRASLCLLHCQKPKELSLTCHAKKQWTPLLSQKQKKHSRGRHSISSVIFFLMEEKTAFIRIFNEDIVTLLKKALLFIRISQRTLSKKTLLFLHIFSPRRILFWRKQVINTKRTFLRHSRKKSLLQYSHKLNSFSFLHLTQKKEKIILLKTKFCLRKAGVIKRKQQRKQRKTKERERFFSRGSGSLSSRYPL